MTRDPEEGAGEIRVTPRWDRGPRGGTEDRTVTPRWDRGQKGGRWVGSSVPKCRRGLKGDPMCYRRRTVPPPPFMPRAGCRAGRAPGAAARGARRSRTR